jgi:RNA polymerase sigma-70 factor (ECF subfamily)
MTLLSLRRMPPSGATPRVESTALTNDGLVFENVYEENLTYVWRAAHRLGIAKADTDDVVQEVFLVAHRRLAEFQRRSSVKTWLFKILLHVVRHHQRTRARKPDQRLADSVDEIDALRDDHAQGPAEAAERADAVRVLDTLLGQLDSEKREVFVLAEVEQLTSVEIADILDLNVNTVYSRLRSAKQDFQRLLVRFQTWEFGRTQS